MTRQKVSQIGLVFLFVLLVVLGGSLRFKNYALVPIPGESTDDYMYSWLGLSLVRLGLPVSRSGLSAYGGNDYRYINVDRFMSVTPMRGPLEINRPWFDHPPLLGLITGGYAYLTGAKVFEDATATIIRKPIIGLSLLSGVMFSLLAYLVGGKRLGLTYLTLAMTSPLMVVFGRMGQAESGLLVTFPAVLLFLLLFQQKGRQFFLWLAAASAGISVWFKLSGIITLVFGAVILLTQEGKSSRVKIWEILTFIVIPISFVFSFVVYGAVYDLSSFAAIQRGNSARPYDIGFGSIFDLLTVSRVTIAKHLTDGWPLVGWAGLFRFWQRRHNLILRFVITPLFSYLIVFLLMGSSAYGWYRLPFMPFLLLLASVLVIEGFTGKNRSLAVLLILVPLGINLGKLDSIYHLKSWYLWWRPVLPLTLGWFFLTEMGSHLWLKKLNRIFFLIVFLVVVASNVLVAYSIGPDYWLKAN